MRSSLVTFLIIIGSFVTVANVYPILFPTELPMGRIAMLETPREIPNAKFTDESGAQVDLKAFEGSYVFVNVWATWCEPCREEMPALDQLARDLRGNNIELLPISIDVNGAGAVERFYKRHDLKDLPVYMDPTQNIMRALNVVGIPTTVLIGPDGRELGRMIGPAQWDRPETVRQLQEIAGS